MVSSVGIPDCTYLGRYLATGKLYNPSESFLASFCNPPLYYSFLIIMLIDLGSLLINALRPSLPLPHSIVEVLTTPPATLASIKK